MSSDEPHTSPPADLPQALAAVAELTAQRDAALTRARDAIAGRDRAHADRDAARAELTELRRFKTWAQQHPCPARTPLYDSPCRWPFGHDGRHQTLGGWTWGT